MGRTLQRWMRCYVDGIELSGYVLSVNELGIEYPVAVHATLTDQVQGGIFETPSIKCGPINGVFDGDDSGLQVLGSAGDSDTIRNVMIAIGEQDVPAEGNQVFMAALKQTSYKAVASGGLLTATLILGSPGPESAILYDQVFGSLLHEKSDETAANDQSGIDDNGSSSSAGGFMMYHIFSAAGTGNVTLKVQDASTNSDGSFGDLASATSGAIADTDLPISGIVQLGKTATVKRYLRWQIVLDGITSVNFALGFVRGR